MTGSSTLRSPSVSRPRRRVLVLTGDPRPGQNSFDHEVERIRDCLRGTAVSEKHVAMIGLGEIVELIDRERSLVLHVAAHHGLEGVALGLDARTLFVEPDVLAATVGRSSHRPRCTVLNFCQSADVGQVLASRLASVIAWPGQVEDAQAACFTSQFYRHLISGAPLRHGAREAATLVTAKWPELEPPVLFGDWLDPVL